MRIVRAAPGGINRIEKSFPLVRTGARGPRGPAGVGEGALTPVSVTIDNIARPYDMLEVTCSTADITITLPDATISAGAPIMIRKVDATAFAVRTAVKDIAFQNSSLYLISNGVDWVL